MSEEKQKMIAGELYLAGDATLSRSSAGQTAAAPLQSFGA